MSIPYPLTAIVGQEDLIEALLTNAVSPEIGGVLVRGERGTAKSTAVRGLAPLLPPVTAASGQAFAFAPGELAPDGSVPADAAVETRPATLVELPLGASLDRLVGALDLGRALAGEKAFEAGLLARAHQGILYVDEVNLLPDHLVDALLDAAASGVSRVERDAVSAVHAARFLLVGTMNVEEGELRPQLLDRFGLGVEVRGPRRARAARRDRAAAPRVRARPRGVRAPTGGRAEEALAARIAVGARAPARASGCRERELLRIVAACAALGIDGVRGDIVTARTARALAALDGDDEVGEEHVRRAAAMALLHRRRRDPLDGRTPSPDDIERALDDEPPDDPPPEGPPPRRRSAASRSRSPRAVRQAPARERRDAPGPPRGCRPRRVAHHRHRQWPGRPAGAQLGRRRRCDRQPGRRARQHRHRDRRDAAGAASQGEDPRGSARARARRPRERAALPRRGRQRLDGRARRGWRASRARCSSCCAMPTSAATASPWSRSATARRQLLVPPGAPLEIAAEAIRQLPTGGRTPLAAGPRAGRAGHPPRVGARPRPADDRRDPDRRARRRIRRRGAPCSRAASAAPPMPRT